MNPRHIAPLGREVVCPACGKGTFIIYPITKDGNITGHERRCSFLPVLRHGGPPER